MPIPVCTCMTASSALNLGVIIHKTPSLGKYLATFLLETDVEHIFCHKHDCQCQGSNLQYVDRQSNNINDVSAHANSFVSG